MHTRFSGAVSGLAVNAAIGQVRQHAVKKLKSEMLKN
jgi:hypothetical protein